MSRIGALELRDAVLDTGSFRSWDTTPLVVDGSEAYQRELDAAAAKTGLDESVLTGEGTVFGRRVALVACEFDFLAGSIGVAAAERITTAVARATAERLPLVASPSSGGTRMQEGTVAFLQMVKITAAVELHKRAHLPYLVYLRHPTTGGVFASWGSLGHVTAAEPGALIGFLGPRVYEHLYGEPFPAGVQTAENLERHGVIDGVVPLERGALDARPHAEGPRRPARAATAAAAKPRRYPTCLRGSRWWRLAGRTGPAWVICCGTEHPNGCCCRVPAVARMPPRCWRWPDSAASRRWCSASSVSLGGYGRVRRRCARRDAAWRWPRGSNCLWCS